ncbi:hypothetical protein JXA80_02555 [bacterium]|nr:hypothetical protein [candidate division CSSED10-310 bacterium]
MRRGCLDGVSVATIMPVSVFFLPPRNRRIGYRKRAQRDPDPIVQELAVTQIPGYGQRPSS